MEAHRHCIVCGKAIAPEKFFCSPACEEAFKLQQKRMMRARFFMVAVFIAIFVLFMIFTWLSAG